MVRPRASWPGVQHFANTPKHAGRCRWQCPASLSTDFGSALALDVRVDGLGRARARARRGGGGRGGGGGPRGRGGGGGGGGSAGGPTALAGLFPGPRYPLVLMGLGEVPSAMMTASASILNSLPSMGTGRRRPEASGSPSSMRMQVMDWTWPFSSPSMEMGLVSRSKMMPSSLAWWTSSARAGSSASERR